MCNPCTKITVNYEYNNNRKRFVLNQSVRVIFIFTICGYVEQPTPGAPIAFILADIQTVHGQSSSDFQLWHASLPQRFHTWYNNPFQCCKRGNWNSETHKCSWSFFTKCFVMLHQTTELRVNDKCTRITALLMATHHFLKQMRYNVFLSRKQGCIYMTALLPIPVTSINVTLNALVNAIQIILE